MWVMHRDKTGWWRRTGITAERAGYFAALFGAAFDGVAVGEGPGRFLA